MISLHLKSRQHRKLRIILERLPLFLARHMGANCLKEIILYSGPYNHLADQKLVFLPLYCAATLGDKRPTVVLR